MGRIPAAARLHGYDALGSDLVDRGFPGFAERPFYERDFFTVSEPFDNIVCNPPFDSLQEFALHALKLAAGKVAMIWPVPRLNAAGHWLRDTPLRRVWLMTPRPSMPPGQNILDGEKPGGGTVDFCWLVWEKGYKGNPALFWLNRDRD